LTAAPRMDAHSQRPRVELRESAETDFPQRTRCWELCEPISKPYVKSISPHPPARRTAAGYR